MRVIILCGGSGSRLEYYSLPKPLNMINGKPAIAYCLENIPACIDTLYFIASPHLAKYHFEEVVKNLFKNKTIIVKWIPYFTRGPIESAWLGTSTFPESDEPVVFLDNDVVYNFPSEFFNIKDSAFLGYSIDKSSSEAFSFLMIDNGYVTNYKEKKRISDNYGCGVYGFKNMKQFRETAFNIISQPLNTELYMSLLFQQFLTEGEPVRAIEFNGDILHIGSLPELRNSWDKINKKQMRVCFDLDNTLVTYPAMPGDYRTVKPIQDMIEILRRMKRDGHTIIIHTARRMSTHNHNVGAVIRDIGFITLQTLYDFDIPYDEIIFGKPIADIYIDDRSVNPYNNSVETMGYLNTINEKPINMLGNNKYNDITLKNNVITKTGPATFLRGEIFFYENIPTNSQISSYFPKYITALKGSEMSTLMIENIPSIPFYTLFKHELISEAHIVKLFEFLDILHALHGEIPSVQEMTAGYGDKLRKRFETLEDYPYPDAKDVQEKCLGALESYVPQGVAFIHGDLWFSNILVDYKNNIKMIDMKGQLNGKLTTGGDRMYDYGKLYQSILGYDAVLYGDSIPEPYVQKIKGIFIREIERRNVCITDITKVTISLIIGTLHAINNHSTKQNVWDFIKSLMGL